MSDTDLKALSAQFYEHMEFLPGDSDYVDKAWEFIAQQFQVAVPLAVYEEVSTNLGRIQEKAQALPGTDELVLLMESVMYPRGNDVRLWPEDEAAAYRHGRDTHSITEGTVMSRRVMFVKAAEKIGQRIDVSL